MEQKPLICYSCNCPLERKRVDFIYLGHSFHVDAPQCPKCGQVLLSEELVRGRMAEAERQLEDK